ncbi:MAG TPA: LemA family protein [Magnetospirillum sp.]|nr:LemA family protein [Magnetospirillum sp.]
MSTKNIVVLAVLAVLALIGLSSYNGLVGADEKVNAAWGQVQTQYQRRADLIPSLVETVKGYAAHERGTLEAVLAARAKATQVNVSTTDPKSLEQFKATQGELSATLARLMAVVEAYPNLKADGNFRHLQDELAGTENRIAVARRDFNDSVRAYNTSIRSFPGVMMAGMIGLQRRSFFEADEAAAKAPSVKF